ncbi:MAG TPA: dephospho-CoA kinase [Frankiaceae bacterium]|nr:dephospho-CoA kinase [Frankiaceae bacterium]
MKRVGLTGGIGAGKSTVARMLASHGAVIVDSDAIARQVVAPATPGLAEIVEEFGPGVLQADGTLDRPGLGRIVFNDSRALRRLEQITHPKIQDESARLIADAEEADAPVMVHDIPLLVESGVAGTFEAVIVVEASDEIRLERLEGRGLPREQALERMKAQATNEQRRAAATYLIVNDGSTDDLRARVGEVWDALVR